MTPARLRIGLNEMVERDVYLLSRTDRAVDSDGGWVELSEGKVVLLYADDEPDERWRMTGVVERNHRNDWSRHVAWCVRVTDWGDGGD